VSRRWPLADAPGREPMRSNATSRYRPPRACPLGTHSPRSSAWRLLGRRGAAAGTAMSWRWSSPVGDSAGRGKTPAPLCMSAGRLLAHRSQERTRRRMPRDGRREGCRSSPAYARPARRPGRRCSPSTWASGWAASARHSTGRVTAGSPPRGSQPSRS